LFEDSGDQEARGGESTSHLGAGQRTENIDHEMSFVSTD
jgi:hypothetical protein